MNGWIFRENNLDLIRLIAASQVAVLHSFEFMFPEKTGGFFFEILRLFPGVPIFFFISGLLISKSYESSKTISSYAQNRVLRIFPALIVVVFLNIIMVWSTGYFDEVTPGWSGVLTLLFAKATILQFYNPEFMRGFGDGVLNGSLWTICVELQFYLLTPLLYMLFSKEGELKNTTLLVLISVFVALNLVQLNTIDEYSQTIAWKLFRVSFAPWFYMFLVGVYVQRNFSKLASLIYKIPFLPLLVLYVLVAFYLSARDIEFGNYISPLIYFPLILLVIRGAYFMPGASKRLLRGQDISYGIYIWHMPIVNQLLYLGWDTNTWQALLVIFLTFALAVTSWFVLEKPMIHFKKYTIK